MLSLTSMHPSIVPFWNIRYRTRRGDAFEVVRQRVRRTAPDEGEWPGSLPPCPVVEQLTAGEWDSRVAQGALVRRRDDGKAQLRTPKRIPNTLGRPIRRLHASIPLPAR